MNQLFDYCVFILEEIARITGLTYQEANIWIFVIIHPLITLGLAIWVFRLRRKLHHTGGFLIESH